MRIAIYRMMPQITNARMIEIQKPKPKKYITEDRATKIKKFGILVPFTMVDYIY